MAEPERRTGRRVLDALAPYLLLLAAAVPFGVAFLLRLRQGDVRWGNPWALLLLGALPLCAWTGFHLERRRSGTLLFSRTAEARRAARSLSTHLVHLPPVLRLIALALLVVALAAPQRLTADATEIEGIDIVIALDVSHSMHEADLVPDRITAAKRVIDRFITQRPTDRIGLTIFGREAFVQCPLTVDKRALRLLLASVQLGLIDGQGTAIGNAIGTSINRLRDRECGPDAPPGCREHKGAKNKVIVLVTDGDDNASKLDPKKAAQLAQTFGIRVFTILIGRDVEAQAPAQDRFGNFILARPRYPVNPKLLEEIAGMTGGIPFLATDSEALEKRFQTILEELERSKLRTQEPHKEPLYPWLVFLALCLILVEIGLSLTRFRRFP